MDRMSIRCFRANILKEEITRSLRSILINSAADQDSVLEDAGVEEGSVALISPFFDKASGDDANDHSIHSTAIN